VNLVLLEPSGESRPLAVAEAEAVAATWNGSRDADWPGLIALRFTKAEDGDQAAQRLALIRRAFRPLPGGTVEEAAAVCASDGASAAVRRLGRPTGGARDPAVLAVGAAYVRGGGRIDLERPARTLWLTDDPTGTGRLLEEIPRPPRTELLRRRISLLPFQRPIGLDPRLARAAANLARLRPGDRVLDPFLGTGALLAEAGLLGARLVGLDVDATMVRGALQNLAFLGLAAEAMVEGDAGEVEVPGPDGEFDAILTDPPYGRGSTTGGEPSGALAARVLTRWAGRVRPGGRVVVVMPGGDDPLPPPWRREVAVPVRAHRSLTREFRVYVR